MFLGLTGAKRFHKDKFKLIIRKKNVLIVRVSSACLKSEQRGTEKETNEPRQEGSSTNGNAATGWSFILPCPWFSSVQERAVARTSKDYFPISNFNFHYNYTSWGICTKGRLLLTKHIIRPLTIKCRQNYISDFLIALRFNWFYPNQILNPHLNALLTKAKS